MSTIPLASKPSLPEIFKDRCQDVDNAAQQALDVAEGGSVRSWLTSANIKAKPRAYNVYFGGDHVYCDKLDTESGAGYPRFVRYPCP